MSEELWDDLSGKAKRAIRRGDRRLSRDEKRWQELDAKNKNLTPAQEFFAKREKEEQERLEKEQESKALAEQMGYGVNYQDILNTVDPETNLTKNLLKKEIKAADDAGIDYGDLNTYISPEERNSISPQYQFATGKSKATRAEEARIAAEIEKERQLEEWENSMRSQTRKNSFDNEDESDEEDPYDNYRKLFGGLPKAQIGVKSPTNGVSKESDATAMTPGTGPLAMTIPAKKQEWRAPMLAPADEKDDDSALPDILNPNKFKEALLNTKDTQKDTQEEDDLIAQDFESKRDFNGEAFNQKLNAGIDAFTGIICSRKSLSSIFSIDFILFEIIVSLSLGNLSPLFFSSRRSVISLSLTFPCKISVILTHNGLFSIVLIL